MRLEIEPDNLSWLAKRELLPLVKINDLDQFLQSQYHIEQEIEQIDKVEEKFWKRLFTFRENSHLIKNDQFEKIFEEIKKHPDYEKKLTDLLRNIDKSVKENQFQSSIKQNLFKEISKSYLSVTNIEGKSINQKIAIFDMLQEELGESFFKIDDMIALQSKFSSPHSHVTFLKLLEENKRKIFLQKEIKNIEQDFFTLVGKDTFKDGTLIKESAIQYSLNEKIDILAFHHFDHKMELIETKKENKHLLSFLFLSNKTYLPYDYIDIYEKFYERFLSGEFFDAKNKITWQRVKDDYIKKYSLSNYLGCALGQSGKTVKLTQPNQEGINLQDVAIHQKLWELYGHDQKYLTKNNQHLDLMVHVLKIYQSFDSNLERLCIHAKIPREERKYELIPLSKKPIDENLSENIQRLWHRKEFLVEKIIENKAFNQEQASILKDLFNQQWNNLIDAQKSFKHISIVKNNFNFHHDYAYSILHLLPQDHPEKKYISSPVDFLQDHLGKYAEKSDWFDFLVNHWKKQDKKEYVLGHMIDNNTLKKIKEFVKVEFDVEKMEIPDNYLNKNLKNWNNYEKIAHLYCSINQDVYELLFASLSQEQVKNISTKVKMDCLSLLRNEVGPEKLLSYFSKIKDHTNLYEAFECNNPRDERNGKDIVSIFDMIKSRFHKNNKEHVDNCLLYWKMVRDHSLNDLPHVKRKGIKI